MPNDLGTVGNEQRTDLPDQFHEMLWAMGRIFATSKSSDARYDLYCLQNARQVVYACASRLCLAYDDVETHPFGILPEPPLFQLHPSQLPKE
jgi:hypothetical protein